ncbi:uncharacterized protein LOC129713609 [Leucoraja erinacea]|uniref:uncharacterized protein LOC129713609 n=1 Tax=Leucoraja erinaceus TaxID=7782 RepID=UPI002456200A|nr:uncharacterized protein LOC129713609 [Leucoraja erinacea]
MPSSERQCMGWGTLNHTSILTALVNVAALILTHLCYSVQPCLDFLHLMSVRALHGKKTIPHHLKSPYRTLRREEDKQHADTATQTEDAGDTQQVGSAPVGELGSGPTHCAGPQERARDRGERPAGDVLARGPPDYMAVFFTRLDLERNLRALRQGLVCGRLPKNTYEHVAAVMQGYGELQQERLCSLVKSYSSFVRSWEAVRRTSAEGPPPRPLATRMEALHRQKARCWCRVNSRYSERRLQLAALLTSTLKQVEAESGIFLIKPVVSWQGRLESMSKIGTCRKELVRKGRASTLPTACSPAEDGLTGGEEISGQRLHIASRLHGETWRHGSKTHLEPVERAEVTGKISPTATPRLPPI